jgi:hypothetical protein
MRRLVSVRLVKDYQGQAAGTRLELGRREANRLIAQGVAQPAGPEAAIRAKPPENADLFRPPEARP